MITDRPFMAKVLVRFVRREDGGLRAFCDGVPGFFLSGADPRAVMRDVIPALEQLVRKERRHDRRGREGSCGGD